MKLVYILLCSVWIMSTTAQWLDPHDMNTNAKEKYMKPTLKKSTSTPSIYDGTTDLMSDICYSHLKRIVGVLMKSAHVDKRDANVYHGHIRFSMSPHEFDFLVNFGQQDLTLEKLRKLDAVFSEGFKRTYIDEYLDTIESFQLKLYSIVVNIHNLWLLGAICFLYVIYQLFKNDFSFAYVLKYLIIVIITTDFGFRYHHLLEEASEHNLGVVYSKDCDTNKMSWADYTKYLFSSRDCEKKTVTPLDAFLYQIKSLIIIPMHAFGTGMGGFGKNMFTNLPWGLNLVMWPILVVFTLILVLFLMTICTGQSIEFNIFHLVKLKFGGGSRRENALTGSTVDRLLDRVLHRPMVQNVPVHAQANHNQIDEPAQGQIRENGEALEQQVNQQPAVDNNNLIDEPAQGQIHENEEAPEQQVSSQPAVDNSKVKKPVSFSSDKSTNTSYQTFADKSSLAECRESEIKTIGEGDVKEETRPASLFSDKSASAGDTDNENTALENQTGKREKTDVKSQEGMN